MEMLGWICLHRKIKDNWIWEDKPFSFGQAWIHMLLLANHEDKEVLFEGKVITVKRGSFITSILKLSNVFGWDRKKTRRFLNMLETQKMATTNSTTHGTTITIVNYELFQGLRTTHGTTDSASSGTTVGQQFPINNNENNENNIKKENIKRKSHTVFTPPSVEEVQNYCIERSNKVDAQQFVDFYSAKNWMIGKNKMKDWKAAVRTWERRKDESGSRQQSAPVQKHNNFNNFVPRKYDMNDMEKKLLGID